MSEASSAEVDELVEFHLQGVVARQSGSTFHLADDRIKRADGVLWGAEIAQAYVPLVSKKFPKSGREP
jgi:hypothetical protein